MIGSRLRYGLQRRNEYHIHSPFVYELYTNVLRERRRSNVDYELVMRIGRMLDGRRHIFRNRRRLARFFYRCAAYYELEEVTLFGPVSAMDASAFALGNPHSKVKVVSKGDFVDTLNSLGVVNVERVTVDDPLRYCLDRKGEEALFVFEDIHKNKTYQALWDTICGHPDVVLTIDLYHAGLVFYREGMEKQDFVLRI